MAKLTIEQKLELIAQNTLELQEIQKKSEQENAEFRKTVIRNNQSLNDKLEKLSDELTSFISQTNRSILESRQSASKLERSIAEMLLWRQEIQDAVLRMEAICGRLELIHQNQQE